MEAEQTLETGRLDVRNVGGIDESEVVFEPGVTVLAGRNATNRTSLLQAIMAAHGSDDVSIKADADEAQVTLDLGDDTYTRTLQRRNGTVSGDGDPYLEDSTVADLFAFLLEANEARRAVVTDADLREIIMRPVDTDNIQANIDRLVDERRQISDELDDLDELKGRLPSLEEERQRLKNKIDETSTDLEELETEIDEQDADVNQSREEQAELEEKLEILREKRSLLEDVRYELDTEQESIESLREEKREVQDEFDNLPDTAEGELDDIESRIETLRAKKQGLESELNDLQSVIGFNQEMLEDAGSEIFDVLQDNNESEAVADELLPDDTVSCWTCGSEVDPEQIEITVNKLRELSQETVGEINNIEEELDNLKAELQQRKEQRRRHERLEQRKRKVKSEIQDTEARIETLSERRDDLRKEIETIEADVETLENDAYEEILELHKEANELEYKLGSYESDLERVEDNIKTIEERLDEEADLKARRNEINDEIEALRTKIERTEQQAIEEFNDHMDTVLDLLEYGNLDRIWLERKETEVREGRRKVTKSVFNLHIIRQTDSGTTYEDTIDHLSESEREVTGLIFALAGYLVHDVYETVPFMLLDSLEAIDSSRIATLVEYFGEYSDYLVVALLPEDANNVDANQQIERI